MEGNFAVLFGSNRVSVQALGRYNLIQIIKYASSCNANVKKHALAFLLKLCAFDEAEGFAASVSERRIVTLLKNRYPREMRSSFLVYPLRNEIGHLPERMTGKSRKELEALEEAIRTNRQRSSTLSGSRNNNHRQ